MEQKIKKGKRTWFDNFSSYWITNHNNAPIAITCGQDPEDAEGIADFLISAYNGTHGCGVNPDAVIDLYKVVGYLVEISEYKSFHTNHFLPAFKAAKEAILKAQTL